MATKSVFRLLAGFFMPGVTSPVNITGLNNNTAYTFTVTAGMRQLGT